MPFNESPNAAVDPKALDEYEEEMSTMYVVFPRSGELDTTSRLTVTPTTFQLFNNCKTSSIRPLKLQPTQPSHD